MNKRCLQWFLKFILHLGRPSVSEEDAKAAAEALSAESLATKDDIRKLDKELLIIKWMIGLVIAIDVLPLLKFMT